MRNNQIILSRRKYLEFSLAAAALPLIPNYSFAKESFLESLTDEEIFDAARAYNYKSNEYSNKGRQPRAKKSTRKISKSAIDALIRFEVTSEKVYNKKYMSPTWPRAESGVTIGIGYDLGYVKYEWLKEDWNTYIDNEAINNLSKVCGKNGESAKQLAINLKNIGISIPYKTAFKVFTEVSIPYYVGSTLMAAPEADKLSDTALGALVSLAYNRGPSFNNDGDRFAEMRNIRAALISGNYEKIPSEIRAMKRIWPKIPVDRNDMDGIAHVGLRKRRDEEADLFQSGL
ncbi:MAG: hypothetical protein AB3X37_06400 [Leptothrix ochracea]|uniref:hypothetical protein n=1 Tax=Leptothrix ochracea TaxID=735331 RepID=UPI0034E1B610